MSEDEETVQKRNHRVILCGLYPVKFFKRDLTAIVAIGVFEVGLFVIGTSDSMDQS